MNKRVGLIPSQIQHFPIINNPLNVLIGEESRRKHDYIVKVCNDDAISAIEIDKVKDAQERILQIITAEYKDEKEAEKRNR